MNLNDRATLIEGFNPNKRGHDKQRPLFVSVMNPFEAGAAVDDWGYKRNSGIIYHMGNRIRRFFHCPEEFPELCYVDTTRYVKKHAAYKQIERTDKRENIVNLALYLLHHVEPVTGKVGVPGATKEGTMRVLDCEHMLEKTGLSYDDFNEAAHDLIKRGMLHRQRTWLKKEDGTYGGRPSIYRLTPDFWEKFGIAEQFQIWFDYKYTKLKKAGTAAINRFKRSILTKISDSQKTVSVKPVSHATPPKPDTLQYYQAKLPKAQHGNFQFEVSMARTANPDAPLIDILISVYNQFSRA